MAKPKKRTKAKKATKKAAKKGRTKAKKGKVKYGLKDDGSEW